MLLRLLYCGGHVRIIASRTIKVATILFIYCAMAPFGFVETQEPGLPSHLPSPPKPPTVSASGNHPGAGGGGDGGDGGRGVEGQTVFGRVPALTPPQNEPPPPPPPGGGPPLLLPEVPFGLNHVILILVPGVKLKPKGMPKWFESNIKLSFPITVFFDKLDIPVGSRPFPFRGKRDTTTSNSNLRFNQTIHRAERAALIPRLANLLKSFGVEGKSCLLRTICEVHEHPLERRYGFLGQLLTTFFSISRSAFSYSHLLEYLQAEQTGLTGDCTPYFASCNQSMFTWQQKNSTMRS